MTKQAFNFYLNDGNLDVVGSFLFNREHALKVVAVQHVEEDEEKPRIGMICEPVLGRGGPFIVNQQNCHLYEIDLAKISGPLQAIWGMLDMKIEDLKKHLRKA